MEATQRFTEPALIQAALEEYDHWRNVEIAIGQGQWDKVYDELMSFFVDVTQRTTIADMKIACQYWLRLIDHRNDITVLCQRGFNALSLFPSLTEEQMIFAQAVAQW